MSDTTIHKCRKAIYYSKISNLVLQDKRLSFKARGLIAYILSLPDDWVIQAKHLETESPQGREAIYSALQELAVFGYMQKEYTHNDEGHIIHTRWIAYDEPNSDANRTTGFPKFGESATTKEISELKRKEEDKRAETLAKAIEIYNTYPRKIARPVALKAILKSAEKITLEELHKHVKAYAEAVATWPKEQREFVPHPASWINQERWNDERSEWYRKAQPQQQKFTRPEYREMPTAN